MAANNDEGRSQSPKRTDVKVCGIVMPIAAIGDEYSEEHWRRVRKILQTAIERADMQPQLVWENPEVDVIQSIILQNLYENDVVVCDVSGLNPNVMLETGIRLSTRRPTVIITDKIHKPPFDISTIGYIEYQKDLEYNAIDGFIDRLSKKIKDVADAYGNNTYKSFVEQFTFETVTPATVSVTSDEYIREKIDGLANAIARLERRQRAEAAGGRLRVAPSRPSGESEPKSAKIGEVIFEISEDDVQSAEAEIDRISGVYCMPDMQEDGTCVFSIHKMAYAKARNKDILEEIDEILSKYARK